MFYIDTSVKNFFLEGEEQPFNAFVDGLTHRVQTHIFEKWPAHFGTAKIRVTRIGERVVCAMYSEEGKLVASYGFWFYGPRGEENRLKFPDNLEKFTAWYLCDQVARKAPASA